MKYSIADSRQYNPSCYTCDKLITRSEKAHTRGKRKYCFSCGRMENQYADEGMYRPAVVFYKRDKIERIHNESKLWIESIAENINNNYTRLGTIDNG